MNPLVDQYIAKAKKWQAEMTQLRTILLSCKLTEELKWSKPCYTFNGSNLIMIQAFKDHCDLGIFNGALLKDPKNILTKAGEHTQAARQIRFTDIKEIEKLKTVIKSYIKESILIESEGKKLIPSEATAPIVVEELQAIFKNNKPLKKAFEALTPGRQRAYHIFFSAAKQSETRISRINNYSAKIMCGKGMNDCTCGLSKRMPNCDGSHKFKKV